MKNPDKKTVSRLVDLPNIGKMMAYDLQLIGIDHPKKLIGKRENFLILTESTTTARIKATSMESR